MKKNGEFVGVDDKFIPEDEKYIDDSIIENKEESSRKAKKIAKGISIGYICWFGIVIALMIGMFIFAFTQINKMMNMRSPAKQQQMVQSEEQQQLLNQEQQNLQ